MWGLENVALVLLYTSLTVNALYVTDWEFLSDANQDSTEGFTQKISHTIPSLLTQNAGAEAGIHVQRVLYFQNKDKNWLVGQETFKA